MDPNFKYTITIDGVTVSSLNINLTTVNPIEASGKVSVDTGLPFFIDLKAVLDNPAGSGTFQLTDIIKNKDVFDKPQDMTFDNSGKGGLFLNNVKLP
jgi:hypothetical protein